MNKEKDLVDDLEAMLSDASEGGARVVVEITEEHKENHEKILACLDGVIDMLASKEGVSRERIETEQKPIVVKALEAYITGVPNYIIEAPTGTGKSIIGLMITESIYRYNGMTSAAYTLTPTKILQDQLDDDNKRMNLGWALLKGQSNYICEENGEIFPKRKCSKMSISQATKNLECAKNCEYIQRRLDAILSHNSVLSYAYWLTAMNYMYANLGDMSPFQPREVTVFDECHLITDTVQSLFQVEISQKVIDYVSAMVNYYESREKDIEKLEKMFEHHNHFKECFDIIFKIAKDASLEDIFKTLLATTAHLHRITQLFFEFQDKYFAKNEKLWTVAEQEFDKNFEKYITIVSNMKFFLANNKDIENIVVDKQDGLYGTTTLLFRTLNEPSLLKRHCHEYTNFAVWTSATLGGSKGIETWAQQNGIEKYDYHSMDSTFEFPNSPINICRPTISMSFKDKEGNMGAMMMRIMALCAQHPNERGIIHTGNFEIARNLAAQNGQGKERFIFYNNSKEKEIAIQQLKDSDNSIIVGPSLSEGLDLKNDLARFAILAKVPYPNLGDQLIKLKQERLAGWYDWQTVVTIMQQLGRHIRHKTDWGVTYMLDSSFERIISSSTFPAYISDRFTQINVNKLIDSFKDQDDDLAEFF